jgi:hypothetical protein
MATILAEEHGDDFGHRVMRADKNSSRVPISRSDNNKFAKNPLPISITMMTIERGKQGGNARSGEEPTSFIEEVAVALPPSTFGSFLRSAAASSHAATDHREPLQLHRGRTPIGITPFSTWVKAAANLNIHLDLNLATPAPLLALLRPATPAEMALDRPGSHRPTLKAL